MQPTEKNPQQPIQNLTAELAAVAEMPHTALVAKYTELTGTAPRSRNTPWLRKRVAMLLQTGGDTAPKDPAEHQRMEALASEAEAALRRRLARPRKTTPRATTREQRKSLIPAVGSTIQRSYKGVVHEVSVTDTGFVHNGTSYKSLSAVAKAITGSTWNGLLFFGLIERGARGGKA